MLGTEFEFVRYEMDSSQGYDEERVILKNENGIRSYPKDMVEAYSQYEMAKGGEIAEYRVTPNKRGQGSLSHIVEADYKMSFTINGSKQEADKAAQLFVTENNATHPTATVTKIHPSGQPLKNKKVSYVTKYEISKLRRSFIASCVKIIDENLKI